MINRYKHFPEYLFHAEKSRIKIDQHNPDKEASLNTALDKLNMIFLEKTKNRRGKKNRRSRK